MNHGFTVYQTLKKHKVVILKNPSFEIIRDGKGKVKERRKIQYSRDHTSIYLEEQKKIEEKPKPTSLWIKGTNIKVLDDDIGLIKFLDATEQNEANGGKIFKKLDVEKEELYQIEALELHQKAINAIMGAKETEIRAMAMWFLGDNMVHETINKIKLQLTRKANDETFRGELLDFIAEKASEEKLMIAAALKEGVIMPVDGKKVAWKDGETIFIASQAKDIWRDFSVWLKTTKEGREYLALILEKMPKEDKRTKK